MQPWFRKAPRWAWVLQEEEHLPVMSRSLISIRPRRQIPARAGPEHITGCPPALPPSCSRLGDQRDRTRLQPSCLLPAQAGCPIGLSVASSSTHGGRWAWGSSGRRAGRHWLGLPAVGTQAGSCSAPPSQPTSRCRTPLS